MQIVIVGPVFPIRGGIAHHTGLLANALSNQHNVTVISFCRLFPRWLYPGREQRDTNIMNLRLNIQYVLDSLNPITWWRTVLLIRSLKPSVVIFQWWVTFLAPVFTFIAWWLKRRGVTRIFIIHNVLPHETRIWDPLLARMALHLGNLCIVQSENQKKKLVELLPQANVELVDMPIFDLFAGQQISKEKARERLSLPQEEKIALFFGFVRKYKGLEFLISALALLRDRGYPVKLLVVGEFWEGEEKYRSDIAELGLEQLVVIINRYVPNEEVPVYFCASDVFVAPYIGGTQSAVIKTAMAFGLPIVLTDLIADEHKTDGLWVVPPQDSGCLAKAISEALSATPKGTAYSYASLYSWDRIVKVIEQYVIER